MICHPRGFRIFIASFLLAVLALGAAPAASQAGWLGFRNDLKGAVIVQTGIVVQARVRPAGKPKLLGAGAVAWDVVLQPGIRQVKIVDAATNQLLLLRNIPVQGDMFLSIQLDAAGGIKLTPIKAPVAPAGRGQ